MKIFNRNAKRKDLDPPEVLHPAARRGVELIVLDAKYPRASCWEQCGECETEFVMAAYRPEACPHCGMAVLPCNMCDPDTVDCRDCPYEAMSGRRIGPDNRSRDEIEGDRNRKHFGRRRR